MPEDGRKEAFEGLRADTVMLKNVHEGWCQKRVEETKLSANKSHHPFEIPKSQTDLDALLKVLRGYADRQNFSSALALCQHLIIHDSTRMAGYRERAEIWQAMSEHDLALFDFKKLVTLGSIEPADYYNFGIALLRNTEAKEAVGAFTRCIDLGVEHQFSYYAQSCRFHRAAAFLRLGMTKEALDDCNEIEDGYRCFLPSEGVKTREDLVELARKGSKE